MKKACRSVVIFLLIVSLQTPVFAKIGDMGYAGGISEGSKLPKTTETLLKDNKSKKSEKNEFLYKEMLFLSGAPVVFEGLITVTTADPDEDKDVGSYNETYVVKDSTTGTENVSISRNMKLKTNYRKIEGSDQIITDSSVTSWKETIDIGDTRYRLDEKASYMEKSIIEDHKPGVTYYKGNISQRAVYTTGNTEDGKVTVQTTGTIYGFDCAWASVETQRLDVSVYNEIDGTWQLQAQVRPSVSVNKTLQYSINEPTAISFEGNYYEVTKNTSALSYDIFVMPQQFEDGVNKQGNIFIDSYNSFEQLVAPDVSNLKGHFAEDDIRKLFSMQVLDGDPKFYVPSQAITRGQFVTALVKAVKLPIEEPTTKKSSKKTPTHIVFSDMTDDRSEYPYIMAAYDAGLIVGKQNGLFVPDDPIDRQEAFVIMLRTLGLESLGINGASVTRYVDDRDIANWAQAELYAATKINLISPDLDGKIRPQEYLSKADAAALLVHLTNYMRHELSRDYVENIVGYTT